MGDRAVVIFKSGYDFSDEARTRTWAVCREERELVAFCMGVEAGERREKEKRDAGV